MLTQIRTAPLHRKFETARRLGVAALVTGVKADRYATLRLLHETCIQLGDFAAARAHLEQIEPSNEQETLEVAITLGADLARLSGWGYFRRSAEEQAGFTIDEYCTKYTNLARAQFQKAIGLARSSEQKKIAAAAIRNAGHADLLTTLEVESPIAPEPKTQSRATETGRIEGTIRFADGSPVGLTQVVLGLEVEVQHVDVANFTAPEMHAGPKIGELKSVTTTTNAQGEFVFDAVPVGTQAFIAVVLDPALFDVNTRFVAQSIPVTAGNTTKLELSAEEWTSAAPREVPIPLGQTYTRGSTAYRRVHLEVMKNPFHFDFPKQAVKIKLPVGVPANPKQLLLISSAGAPGERQVFQLHADELTFFTQLPAMSDRIFGLYVTDELNAEPFERISELQAVPDAGGKTAVINTGRASFRIAWGDHADATPALVEVRGEDSVWRGRGRFVLPEGIRVVSRSTRVTQAGPLVLSVSVTSRLSNDEQYTLNLTAHRDEPYLLVHEISPGIDQARFEFSLKEFAGGRGFLHWTPEHGNLHWTTLEAKDVELARLQESVPWWISPAGFACAVTKGTLDSKDYIGVFSIRRGDWIDREFEKICRGPGDSPAWRRELEWPYPEMVGATPSMITANTTADGDVTLRFNLFDGERHWGILVSSLERNDGVFKEISAVQHKNSSPRLQDFKDWRLDEMDSHARPHVVAQREELRNLRLKKNSPAFKEVWRQIEEENNPGPTLGVRFAVNGDPLVAWRKKIELVGVAGVRSRMTLLGRDYADMYSPVGARPITQWAEDYDLVAASGVFTADEERLVRTFLMLMAHMYMQTDLMNWKYGARNANFEADRVDVVGAVGLCFDGNPDSKIFTDHVIELMEKSINVYCTPGSGKWYENPACYYFQALKCRMNLAYHLATHGLYDPTSVPRLKDFLRWGILLLTPPAPSHEVMRDGTSAGGYEETPKQRRVAPIGDHAHLGPSTTEHLVLMAKLYRATDPEFADLLVWAYQACGANGKYHGNMPLYFCAMSETDVAVAPAPPGGKDGVMASRRLEGFGAVMRGNFNAPDEFYLLLKQGPAGYRYHRTEGSIILFSNGKPLIYDGGEAGETWRHTTLSFHDVQLPMSAGHIERFHSFDALDMTQGVHPEIIKPGEPVQLNDICNHELVEVAYQRFAKPNPAVVRSVFWVKDEYVILHDELDIDPALVSHWHMQVVADSQIGDFKNGYQFKGRFGEDMQLLLPDQEFTDEKIEQLPILEYHRKPEDTFAMRHLSLRGNAPKHYLGVIRPLGRRMPVTAKSLVVDGKTVGVHVGGKDIDDHLFFQKSGLVYKTDDVSFQGCYGAVLRRGRGVDLLLMGKGELRYGVMIRIQSDGPAVHLRVTSAGTAIECDGPGEVVVTYGTQPTRLQVPPGRTRLELSPNK